MSVVSVESIHRLVEIEARLKRMPKGKFNPIVDDMNWLANELRKAWSRLEGVQNR